ncbi:MAG TPA: efflux RND transporter periplasmic adaptor subunit [Candidatus Limnocylindria bacterium]|nr:efflux RND transporter periplasmic adaptor subunit [Candidatus Limnocylindria bacterium]
MKLLGAILGVLLLVGGGVFGWKAWQRQSAAKAAEIAATSRSAEATVETRNISFAVSAAGEIVPADQVSVRPEVNGKIDKLPVDVGDVVKSGELLFQLDDRDLRIQQSSQKNAIERTKLELQQAERNYRRAEELFKSHLVAQEVFDDAKTSFDLGKNSLDNAQKALDLIEYQLLKTRVTAPFDCTVLTRPVSVGQAVSGSGGFNSGTEILTIANLNDLIINAHINQADVTRLHMDQDVDVTVEAVPGLKITGKVERLAPQATIKNSIKGFAARILLRDVDHRVRPGMTANISIPVASAANVVAAPLAAVFTEYNQDSKQQERFAFVKKGDDWERRIITIGVSDYFFAEVTTGLKAGDIVSLEDKSKTAIKGASPGGITSAR